MPDLQRITIVGSTGSIGQSTLRVAARYPDRLRVVGLAAGRDVKGLIAQAQRWKPEVVAVADESRLTELREALSGLDCKVLAGSEGVQQVASWDASDTAVIAAVGFAGVRPTIAALSAGKKVALANKETLVAAGAVVIPLVQRTESQLVPIDSEHSAIYQCLRAGHPQEVERIILTASGGPFRDRPLVSFPAITPEEALAHPTWKMGPRITIDSATMMNKGFEVIEAMWLFGLAAGQVDVVIHPESIVHSMVEFRDGSVVAQMGIPDMTLPIAYALFGPERLAASDEITRYDPEATPALHFSAPDPDRFPALTLAREAFAMGPTGGAVLNAADEIAVAAFLQGELSFTGIIERVGEVVGEHSVVKDPGISDIEDVDRWARKRMREKLREKSGVTS